ncbi:hypothetical protein Lalb_Chr18g0053231 [Lupinus albus]|uniref:Uncharacterized protein n=1 Tax=Lupinus albus TaxID=3870 RepID=A0A6A4NUI8_LUPAL|nr:hypothetical protein Lalb_Chr18g0053231 [Lupinus albus]
MVPKGINDLVEEDHHTKTSLRRHMQGTDLRNMNSDMTLRIMTFKFLVCVVYQS